MSTLRKKTMLFDRTIFVSMAAAFLFCFSSLASGSFDRAMEIYSDGRFEEARSAFETMAAIGDAASLFNLGVMYFRGEAVERDPVKAYVLMKVANEGVNDESFTKTTQVIFSKLDDTQKKKSEELYREFALIYGAESIKNNIFPELLDDKDCPPDIEPLKRGTPNYPRREVQNGRMGLVTAEFTISPEGYPREIHITSATSEAFYRATLAALDDYLYPPTLNKKPRSERHTTIYQLDSTISQVSTDKLLAELDNLKAKSIDGNILAQYKYAQRLNTYRHFNDYFKERDIQYREANEWFTQSAAAGVANSQFEIGRNMLEGRGCKVDKKNGFKWIKASAVGGYSPAQRFLANSEIHDIAISNNRAESIMSWLRNAAQDKISGFPSKVLLAWELVTSPEKSLLDPDEALALIENPPYTFKDDIRIMETNAAAYALKNNYKKAIKLQKKALKAAKRKGWSIPKITKRLEQYEKKQTYIGSYY
ncbi:energy transducer TonB [Arenicella sp. 4NH20-0111]|uniref:energy transducer TonB n=1 Tax=Arenicella sp. 4NH20-0111 TaxID=3127648 RepID=UPI00333FAC30